MSVTVARMASANSRWSSTIRTRIGTSPRRERQFDAELHPRSDGSKTDGASVRLDDPFRDEQPQTLAASRRVREPPACERIEDQMPVGGGDARPSVTDADACAPVVRVHIDRHRRGVRRVRERVPNHVRDRLSQLLPIGPDHERLRRSDHQIGVVELHPARGDDVLDRSDQVDLLHVERAGSRRPPKERVDQIRQLVELLTCPSQELTARRPLIIDVDVSERLAGADERPT